MNTLLGLGLAAVLLAAVVRIALQTAHWGKDSPVPERRPVWLGPDAVAIAHALRARLHEARAQAGLPTLLDPPATEELSSHHAFDMAARGYGGEEDPEGLDLGERRHNLHPDYVGRLWEFDQLLEPDGPSTEESLLKALTETPEWAALQERVGDPGWNAAGVAVAIEGGRCAVCVVLGAWWATLSSVRPGEAGIGGWRLTGKTAPDVSVGGIAGTLGVDGARVEATPHDDPAVHPRDFTLVLPHTGDAGGLKATVFRGGEPGLIRVLL